MYLHANAKLGLAGRFALVRAIEKGLSLREAAAAFSVLSRTGFRGDLDPRMLSWGKEILSGYVESEEVPRGAARARRQGGA